MSVMNHINTLVSKSFYSTVETPEMTLLCLEHICLFLANLKLNA